MSTHNPLCQCGRRQVFLSSAGNNWPGHCVGKHASVMDGLSHNSQVVAEVEISLEVSDDEVFDDRAVWSAPKPERLSGAVAKQTPHASLAEQHESAWCSNRAGHTNDNDDDLGQISRPSSDEDDLDRNIPAFPSDLWNWGPHSVSETESESPQHGALCTESGLSDRGQDQECTRGSAHHVHLHQKRTIMDGLLFDIYDRWHGSRADSLDSDTVTECSSLPEVGLARWDAGSEAASALHRPAPRLSRACLQNQGRCGCVWSG